MWEGGGIGDDIILLGPNCKSMFSMSLLESGFVWDSLLLLLHWGGGLSLSHASQGLSVFRAPKGSQQGKGSDPGGPV